MISHIDFQFKQSITLATYVCTYIVILIFISTNNIEVSMHKSFSPLIDSNSTMLLIAFFISVPSPSVEDPDGIVYMHTVAGSS